MVFPVKSTNELGQSVTQTFDLGTGVPLSSTGPNAGTGSYVEIDAFGRITETWVTNLSNNYRRASLVRYNDNAVPQSVFVEQGHLLKTLAQWNSYTSAAFSEMRMEFDGLGRPIKAMEWDVDSGAPGSAKAETTFSYDAAGNPFKATGPDPSQDNITATVDYLAEFDSLGRQTCSTSPNGVGVATTIAGRVTRSVEFVPDGQGAGTCANPTSLPTEPVAGKTLTTDIFDRLVREEEMLDSTSSSDVAVTTYAYDDNSNVSQIVREATTAPDPTVDTVTTMSHDWLGNRLDINRHGRTWLYAYDRNDSLLTQVAPNSGQAVPYTTSFAYDDLDWKTSRVMAVTDLSPAELAEFDVGTWIYE